MFKKLVSENTKTATVREKKWEPITKDELPAKQENEQNHEDTTRKIEKKLRRKKHKREKEENHWLQLKRKAELKEILKKETDSKANIQGKSLTKFIRQEIESQIEVQKNVTKNVKNCKILGTTSPTENLHRLTLDEEITRKIDAALSLLDYSLPDKYYEKRLNELKKENAIIELRAKRDAGILRMSKNAS